MSLMSFDDVDENTKLLARLKTTRKTHSKCYQFLQLNRLPISHKMVFFNLVNFCFR